MGKSASKVNLCGYIKLIAIVFCIMSIVSRCCIKGTPIAKRKIAALLVDIFLANRKLVGAQLVRIVMDVHYFNVSLIKVSIGFT